MSVCDHILPMLQPLHTAASAGPSISTPATWSSWLCAVGLGEGFHDPFSRTAVPVDKLCGKICQPMCWELVRWITDLCACAGVRSACRGSRLDPSPMEANERNFWFLIDRMKPLIVTLSRLTDGESRRRAMDEGVCDCSLMV